MLKRPVLVKDITNLSDARYCAGMGVSCIMFSSDRSKISLEQIIEIKNWVSGISIALEITSDQLAESDKVNPDFVYITNETGKSIPNQILYENGVFQFPNAETFLEKDWDVLSLNEFLMSDEDHGIVLNGGEELRPGYRNFGILMDLLELLEVE